jgi:hypothetical protein
LLRLGALGAVIAAAAALGWRSQREVDPRCLDVGDDRPQIGFDTAFEIIARSSCGAGAITWKQVEGARLGDLRLDGATLRARTVRLSHSLPWGIAPIAPRTRGEAAFEATWRGAGGEEVKRVVHVAAAARATGVPSVAVGQRLMLGGGGEWRVRERPGGARAETVPGDHDRTYFTLEPDLPGRWVLADSSGAALAFRAGFYDRTPLDCGRSDCHASTTRAAEDSPMTHALERGVEGRLGARSELSCGLGCHAVGEPGLSDGGFVDVARSLGVTLPAPAPGAWSALPRALRRLGGVGCTACHGPAAIPEPTARWSILRVDVCAFCHDAPPRYTHVAEWSRSRMARSDADPATREPACARCHTTAGFLGRSPAPASAGTLGVTCAACHAPHSAHGNALIRAVDAPLSMAELGSDSDLRAPTGTSRLCVACHAQADGDHLPSATAGILWLAPGPHDTIDGCTGCHGGSGPRTPEELGPAKTRSGPRTPEDLGLAKTDHTFAPALDRCVGCHAKPPVSPGPAIRERAVVLWSVLVGNKSVVERAGGTPPHARAAIISADPRLSRAARLVAMVLEDPAAGVHNAPRARAYLDAAEALLR